MRRTNLFRSCSIIALIVLSNVDILNAQSNIELDPSLLNADPSGYYLAGYWKKTSDGTDSVFYDGCTTEYGGKHHFEAGTQQGFTYQNCMIMPTCSSIDSPSKVSVGYIQLGKTKYTDSYGTENDSSHICSVVSPKITGLDSIYVELSADVTPQSGRLIELNIQYSTDEGVTWSGDKEKIFFELKGVDKIGTIHHINATTEGNYFAAFRKASLASPILIRFMSADGSGYTQGSQRIKLHNLKIYYGGATAVENPKVQENKILVADRNISAKDGGEIVVYNYMGQIIGEGISVYVNNPGAYIVRTESGQAQKILVR